MIRVSAHRQVWCSVCAASTSYSQVISNWREIGFNVNWNPRKTLALDSNWCVLDCSPLIICSSLASALYTRWLGEMDCSMLRHLSESRRSSLMIQSIHHAMLSGSLGERTWKWDVYEYADGRRWLWPQTNDDDDKQYNSHRIRFADGKFIWRPSLSPLSGDEKQSDFIKRRRERREEKNLNLIPKVVKIGTDFFILLNKIGWYLNKHSSFNIFTARQKEAQVERVRASSWTLRLQCWPKFCCCRRRWIGKERNIKTSTRLAARHTSARGKRTTHFAAGHTEQVRKYIFVKFIETSASFFVFHLPSSFDRLLLLDACRLCRATERVHSVYVYIWLVYFSHFQPKNESELPMRSLRNWLNDE